MRVYSWDGRNIGHIAEHGIAPTEAREVVEHARPPFPQYVGDGKWLVRGQAQAGRWLQVVYVYPDDHDVDPDSLSVADLLVYSDGQAQVVRVIHARPLTDAEKRKSRRRGRP